MSQEQEQEQEVAHHRIIGTLSDPWERHNVFVFVIAIVFVFVFVFVFVIVFVFVFVFVIVFLLVRSCLKSKGKRLLTTGLLGRCPTRENAIIRPHREFHIKQWSVSSGSVVKDNRESIDTSENGK